MLQTDTRTVFVDYLIDYGSEEQKRRRLPGRVSGEVIIAMTGPGAGSDLQGVRTTAKSPRTSRRASPTPRA
jgi:alkylation response protein AidB-like acyl-CoA dehydrogenase